MSIGLSGASGDPSACGFAGCDADESGKDGALTQPAKSSASNGISSVIESPGFMLLSFHSLFEVVQPFLEFVKLVLHY
jgi:hypothetical protein